MNRSRLLTIAFVLIIGGGVQCFGAETVIGDFEGGLDGWFERDASLSVSTIGATTGNQSMFIDGPGDWKQSALLDLKQYRQIVGTAGVKIQADVTAFPDDMTTEWLNVGMVINGQNNDDNGPNNNIGWQDLGQQGATINGEAQTIEWLLPDTLTAALAGVDDSIAWFELVLVTNLAADSPCKIYVDNIKLVYPAADPGDDPKSTDTVIGNWEEDLDGWVVSGGADVLYNDQNGVTLDDFSLDVYIADNAGWNQDILTLDVMANDLIDAVRVNTKLTVDITRLVADWPAEPAPNWNELVLIIQASGEGWDASWLEVGKLGNWRQSDGDQTTTLVYDYGQFLPQMNYLEQVNNFSFMFVSNVDTSYDKWILFYLDNMKLIGAGRATNPSPVNNALNVAANTELSWTVGGFETVHHLYLGTDIGAVADANASNHEDVLFVELTDAMFQPEQLEFKTKYYWRIDEVNESNPDSPWAGNIWSFTTGDFVSVDGFEDYSNDPDSGNAVFDTWKDGFGIDENGSFAGHDVAPGSDGTILEGETVRSGQWALPFYYNNTAPALASELQRTWSDPQAWMTGAGENVLKLFIYGNTSNAPGKLYVVLEDSDGTTHRINQPDDADFFRKLEWQAWPISLNDVADAGVKVAAIKKMTMGVENLPGESVANGLIYVDDIQRHPPVPVILDPNHVEINKTTTAPTIDGQGDGIWEQIDAVPMTIWDMHNAASAEPEDAADLSASYKACFDDSYFYFYIEIADSVLDYTFSDWQGDGMEIYFDGDYSQGVTYDGINDNQIRITVNDVTLEDTDSSLPVPGMEYKVLLTDAGYNIEAAFPLDVLQIYPTDDPEPLLDGEGNVIPGSDIAPNNVIGFEVQLNDNDGNGRETILRWFGNDDNSWQNASLFGQARLKTTIIGE